MKKATFIKKGDLANLKEDADGNYIIPEGFEIYIKETAEDRKAAQIAELEKALEGMSEPSDAELIEEGRMMHPYFMMRDELDMLKNKA